MYYILTIIKKTGHLFVFLFISFFIFNLCLINSSIGEGINKDQRIEILEEKLKKVTEEVEKLKEQNKNQEQDNMSSIEEKLNILAEEIEKLKSPEISEEKDYDDTYGLAEGASKVYLTDNKSTSIGGYGEISIGQLVEDNDNTLDAQRAVFYFGHRFNDNIIFNSEIEFEHASTEENVDDSEGSVSVEFAALDFLIIKELNIRAGLLLAPFGIINEQHEPTTFFGVFRPEVELNVIPTTWRENGMGIFGSTNSVLPGEINYRFYAMNSFDSSGFNASNNRDIRFNGTEAKLNNVAFVGRMEYEPHPIVKFGTSAFLGNTGQDQEVQGESIGGFFQMYEGDIQFQYKGLGFKGLLVYTTLDDAELINLNNGLTGNESVGDEQFGWYVEGSYNVLSSFDIHPYFRYLAPFIRYEKYDTQHKVPSGYQRDPNNDRNLITLGLSYKPINNIVFKTDYQFKDNKGEGEENQLNFGLGYVF